MDSAKNVLRDRFADEQLSFDLLVSRSVFVSLTLGTANIDLRSKAFDVFKLGRLWRVAPMQ